MGKSRGSHLKYQVYRSEARKTAKQLADEDESLKGAEIDASQIRF